MSALGKTRPETDRFDKAVSLCMELGLQSRIAGQIYDKDACRSRGGRTDQQNILSLYPDLEADDIREALMYAAEAVRERALPLTAGD